MSKDTILLETLIVFFRNEKNFKVLLPIIHKETNISLRVLDWLVTNYSKKNNINYELVQKNEVINFNIYNDYKNQLKAYSKKYFDPFCRTNRIYLTIPDMTILENVDDINKKDYFMTTLGQLNFLKWFIKNNIINYLIMNIDLIEKDMNDILYNNKQITNKKRCCLSENNSKKMNIVRGNIIIKF